MKYNKKFEPIIVEEIENFVYLLNNELKYKTIIIVEGKKDIDALRFIGIKGTIKPLNEFKNIIDLVDTVLEIQYKIILLLDFDRKGVIITKKILSMLGESIVNMTYKKDLYEITRGKIRKIEEIKSFYSKLLKNY